MFRCLGGISSWVGPYFVWRHAVVPEPSGRLRCRTLVKRSASSGTSKAKGHKFKEANPRIHIKLKPYKTM